MPEEIVNKNEKNVLEISYKMAFSNSPTFPHVSMDRSVK